MPEEPTTPDPEEAIRRSLEALSHRDYEAALAPFSEHAVFDLSAAGAEVIEGHQAIREFFETWRSPYDKFDLVLEEFRDRGNGVTLSVIAQRGQLPGSSSFLSVRGAHVAPPASPQTPGR
jgi:hypothetical protein